MEIDSVLKRALKIFEISTICTSGGGVCVEPRPWSRQAPGGLPSGVWYTPEAAPLPARAGKEARGPLDSGSLPSRRSKPLSQLSAEIPVSWHSARSGTEEIGLFRALTFIASDHIA